MTRRREVVWMDQTLGRTIPSPQPWEPCASAPIASDLSSVQYLNREQQGRAGLLRKAELSVDLKRVPASPLQAGAKEQGTLRTAAWSVYWERSATRATAEEFLQSRSGHIPHGLMQQVPSKSTHVHRISSELPGERAEPSRGSAGTVCFMGEQLAAHTLPASPSGGQDSTKRLSAAPGACSAASDELLAGQTGSKM